MARSGVLILLCAAAVLALAQDARPAFEAASVKVNTSGSGSSSTNGTKSQVLMQNQSMQRLIMRAYGVKAPQIVGPAWLETASYDIAAKYPPDTKDADRALMLRTLLEERFKVAVHHETKEMQGYALVVAKGGFKLKPSEAGTSGSNSNSSNSIVKLTATKVGMDFLASYLTSRMDGMVIDKTGLDGVYDFQLQWTTDDKVDTIPTLGAALQDVLGLRLQPQKIPVDMLVIDHIERTPLE